jgi:hypothetical protein
VQHRQEAKIAAAEERERVAARAARLTMAELAATTVEVEAAAVVAELEALRASSTGSSVSADDDRDNELKLAREAVQEQAAQWAATHPQGHRGGSPDGRGRAGGAPGEGVRRWQPRQAWTRWRLGGRRSWPLRAARLSLPGQVPWSPWDLGHCQGRRSRWRVAYPPHQDQLCRVGHGDEGTTLGAAYVGSNSV